MTDKTIVLIDGENLLFRFQETLKSGGEAKESVLHTEDRYLWSPESFPTSHDILRVSYYTTAVGDHDSVIQLSEEIAQLPYHCKKDIYTTIKGTLNPHVFKKEKQKSKNKSVDINITIDSLRHAYNGSVDTVYLMSGDGDYIPLIKEIMHRGVQVIVGAFSNGCNQELIHTADDFLNLDEIYFK